MLLEILGNQSEPPKIQPYLNQIFDSVNSVVFGKKAAQKNTILEMCDRTGETVELCRPLKAGGVVEAWLQQLIDIMHQTLKIIISDAVENGKKYTNDLQGLINEYPAQVSLVVLQILWTQACEQFIKAQALGDGKVKQQMKSRIEHFLSQLVGIVKQNQFAREFQRTAVETMITIQVHQSDIFANEVCGKIRDVFDFDWLKQTRAYYYGQEGVVKYQITDISFTYSYEYLGVSERLVITPLTDRCYITLAQAIGLSMGGAPAGPAGTGKTETCKDLGKTVGQYVVVFNCSDQMDSVILGKTFKGLCQGGIFGDFDEFNRIDLSVMSVAA